MEPRRRARAFVAWAAGGAAAQELLDDRRARRRSRHPYWMQHLLARAVWDADAVRDDLRGYVIEHLGDPDAVLWSTRPET